MTFVATGIGPPLRTARPSPGRGAGAAAAMAIDNARLYEAERRARTEAEAATRARDAFLARSRTSCERRSRRSSPGPGCCRRARSMPTSTARLGDDRAGARALPRRSSSRICSTSRGSSPASCASMSARRSRVGDPGWDRRRPARADAKHIRVQAVLDPEAGTVAGDPERLQQVAWNSPLQCRQVHAAGRARPGGAQTAPRARRGRRERHGQGIRPPLPAAASSQRFAQADSSTTVPTGASGSAGHRAPHRRAARRERPRGECRSGQGRGLHGQAPAAHAADSGRGRRPAPEGRRARQRSRHARPGRSGVSSWSMMSPTATTSSSTLLSSCGAEVRIAGSVAQALKVLAQWRTDVLVTGHRMPARMDTACS